MCIFAPGVVSFDLAPPLQCLGADALRSHWERTFSACEGTIAYETHHVLVIVGGDVAFGHSLDWMRAKSANSQETARWLRWTACFRRADGRWLITHEHVSVPVDFGSGKA